MAGGPSHLPAQPGFPLQGAAWAAFARITRRLLLAAALLLALLGAATAPPAVVLLWAPGLGLVTGSMIAVGNRDFPRTATARRSAWVAGTTGTLLLPFGWGLALVGDAGAVVVAGLLALAGAWVVEWLASADDGEAAARRCLASLERALPELPTSALVVAWRTSGDRLGADEDPRARAVTAQLRALLVDELTRRDPAGVARWLSAGGGDPERHLSGGTDRAG